MGARSARRTKAAVTIADVARLAGVSPMTVSRVINGEPNVRDDKRKLVNTAIGELNYQPNPAARSLAAGKVVRLGLLYANPSTAYLSEFLVGALDECRRQHIQLAVEKCDEGAELAAMDDLLASGVDGLLLPPPLCDHEPLLAALAHQDVPAAVVATGRPRRGVASVRIDDYTAARLVTSHLLGLGHRRIGFIKGHPNQTASEERLRGYLAALAEAGVTPEPDLVAQGFFSFRSGLEAAERLLASPRPPTAIFAANDDMAAATIAAAHRRGLQVPQHLSVCGFDDSASATNVWPELTTIRQPIADMARAAVAVLAERVQSGVADVGAGDADRQLPHVLVRRQSDAPPPQVRRRP